MATKKKPKKKAAAKKPKAKGKAKGKPAQKTLPTTVTVSSFLDKLDPARRADADALVDMMERVTGEKATMWGGSIVGFGNVHYKYDSGHEGDTSLVGFAPRASAFVLYLWGDVFGDPLMQRLGKCTLGKGCLYVKKLADVDTDVLERLVATSVVKVKSRFAAA